MHAAAALLCESGARDGRDLPGALLSCNRSTAYVRRVLDIARRYYRPGGPAHRTPSLGLGRALRARAVSMIRSLRSLIGRLFDELQAPVVTT